jgi:hypothetical protein
MMLDHGVVYRNDDSYCGPISMLARLPGGELVLVFREAKWRGFRTHADPTTRMSLLRSRDGGRTWISQVTPDPTGGNGCAIARLSDGALLANAYHWLFVPIAERDRIADRPRQETQEFLGMARAGGGVFMTRSVTDGYTWEQAHRIPEPPAWPDVACHGQVLEFPDGGLLLPVTGRTGPDAQSHGVVLRSVDRGLMWGEPVSITADAPSDVTFHETRLALCPSGRIVAMHRTPDRNYWRNHSTDGGRTWSESVESAVWCGGSSPPDLRVLADGRLLLTRGYRREPFGVRAYLSTDEGRTWDVEGEIILREDGPDRDVGYPSTAQMADGSLVTVYYWHTDDEIRHLQRTLWQLPD